MTPNWYGQQFYQPVQQPLQTMQPQMAQQMPQQTQPTQTTPQPTQAQQGVFVRVQSEQEARAYPVAPGNSVTFIDENAPYCYTKAVDASALDRPRFDRYRLVKEDDQPHEETPQSAPQYALVDDVEALARRLSALEKKLKKEVAKNESAGE
jgi:hypothetical protein